MVSNGREDAAAAVTATASTPSHRNPGLATINPLYLSVRADRTVTDGQAAISSQAA